LIWQGEEILGPIFGSGKVKPLPIKSGCNWDNYPNLTNLPFGLGVYKGNSGVDVDFPSFGLNFAAKSPKSRCSISSRKRKKR
jgi:hypothetical protein